MSNFIIRDYVPCDYEDVIKLWLDIGLGNSQRGDNAEVIAQTLASGGRLFVLANKNNDEILGTSWLTNDKRRLYLHHFGIKKEYQGKGLSKQLMEASLKFAVDCGLQIKIEVHKENLVALNLYKKYGFKYLGDYDVYIVRNLKDIKI
ncbi:MAG TPA: GNAT family N-acetyltransferase [Bacteroidales bacterium]|nr:GNAT family N-acetyltransferase [Bacteroidales bacterium]